MQKLVEIAQKYVGCSAFSRPDDYFEVVSRPSDGPGAREYYRTVSSCALFVLGVLRLAGVDGPETASPYFPARVGRAFADLEELAGRLHLFESLAATELLTGDIFIVANESGGDAHTGICTSDCHEGLVNTIEGGQFDGHGSTAIGAFTRRFTRRFDGRWMLGSRLLCYVIAGPDFAATLPPDVSRR